ncbi:MAG TPA: nucleotidyltransferase family protein, partial [Gemmatimonadaceae bacterium]|nr:nucleotidyltransferase family protein [Gemmatimonadaceae bacterium]
MGTGTTKLLLPVDGQPMIRVVVGRALDAGLAPVVVVVGHESIMMREALRGMPCRFVENTELTSPMSTSLHVALRSFGGDVDAAVVMLGDMVRVSADMLQTLVRTARDGDAPLVVSRYGDVSAPPLLFRRSLWPELLAYTGEGCGKAVVNAHRHEAE